MKVVFLNYSQAKDLWLSMNDSEQSHMIALNYSSFVLIEFSYLNAIQESFSLQRL